MDSYGTQKQKAEIWLWHRRLGHASFGYLKKLFPSLFTNLDMSILKCNVCELEKCLHALFPSILDKRHVPFMIVHSNTWGPSEIPTLGGSW